MATLANAWAPGIFLPKHPNTPVFSLFFADPDAVAQFRQQVWFEPRCVGNMVGADGSTMPVHVLVDNVTHQHLQNHPVNIVMRAVQHARDDGSLTTALRVDYITGPPAPPTDFLARWARDHTVEGLLATSTSTT